MNIWDALYCIIIIYELLCIGQSLENPSVLNEVVANRSFLMGVSISSFVRVWIWIIKYITVYTPNIRVTFLLDSSSICRPLVFCELLEALMMLVWSLHFIIAFLSLSIINLFLPLLVNHITGGAIAGAVVSFYDYTMPEFSEFHDVDVTSTNPMNSTEQKGLPLTRISSPFSHAGAPGLSILRGILRTSLICGAGGAALFYHRKIVEAQQDWDPDRSVISNILFKEKGSDRNSWFDWLIDPPL